VRCIGTRTALARAGEVIEPALGEYIVTRDNRSLEQVVIELLNEKNATIATAESCTGGFIAHRLTNVPGASNAFIQGFVTYANAAKSRALGVDAALIERHGAVSREVAAAMADGARSRAQTDFAVSATGIAGPGGGTAQKPVGTVYFGVASARGCEAHHRRFNMDRETFKWMASQTALDLVRRSALLKDLSQPILEVRSSSV
jgi:nicotinamide-nucleotide amidase